VVPSLLREVLNFFTTSPFPVFLNCLFSLYLIIYFRRILQLSYLDVAKVDLDVAYISMLQAYVLSVSGALYVCCKCFMWTLHIFAMATHVFLSFFWCFASVSDICCKHFCCFGHILQVFLYRYWKSRSSIAYVAMRPPVAAVRLSCWGTAVGHRTGA
jgi:hypothetical protein